jgi:very-short-patch-repair endonuclease
LEPDAVEHDLRLTNWLAARGFQLIRFRNQELDENTHAVVDAIGSVLGKLETDARTPLPSPPRRGEGARQRWL